MDDRKLAHLANDLTAIATIYVTHQSLRERISRLVVPEIETLRQRVANQATVIGEMEETCINHAQIETALSKELATANNRVKELEAGFDRTINEYEAELATLKQGQGEPVAWLWHHIDNETGMRFDRGLSFSKVDPTNDTFLDGNVSTTVQPLHTSASTIPEGWDDFIQNGVETINALIAKSDCSVDRNEEFYLAAQWKEKAKTMLSAAPKHKEECND